MKRILIDRGDERCLARVVSKMVKNIPEEYKKMFWETVKKDETLHK